MKTSLAVMKQQLNNEQRSEVMKFVKRKKPNFIQVGCEWMNQFQMAFGMLEYTIDRC